MKTGDPYGCLTFHYFEYCHSTQKCQSTMFTSCPDQWDARVTSCVLDEHGCCRDAHQRYCESVNACIDADIFECPYSCA